MDWLLKRFTRKKDQRIAELETDLAACYGALSAFAEMAALSNIERKGRVTTFTFMRRGSYYKIETMGLMSDDVSQWKRDLLN